MSHICVLCDRKAEYQLADLDTRSRMYLCSDCIRIVVKKK